MKKTTSGFTIVELLVVIVVIAILAAITIVAYNGIQDRAKFAKVQADLKNGQKLIELYRAENGSYPATPSGGWLYSGTNATDYIPGIVPAYASSLPQVVDVTEGSNARVYIYKSNGTTYMLLRYYSGGVPAGEWSQVPSDMKVSSYTDRYGLYN
jgi:type II secretion system protein G